MRIYPNAKINIGLSVTERRTDGYHNLETVFYPVGLSLTSFPMMSGLPSILLSASIPANMACGSTPAPVAFPESRSAWI